MFYYSENSAKVTSRTLMIFDIKQRYKTKSYHQNGRNVSVRGKMGNVISVFFFIPVAQLKFIIMLICNACCNETYEKYLYQ